MNSMIRIVVASVAIVSSFSAFAQSNAPVTRGEVKAQLVQLERVGYNPAAHDNNYPQDVHAAISQVNDSEGGVVSGTQNAGSRAAVPAAPVTGLNSVYFGQ